MNDKFRDKIIKIKEIFSKNEKDYIIIQSLLYDLFKKKKYNKEEYEKLTRFLTENQKELNEFRDTLNESNKIYKDKIKNEQDKENEEKLKKENINNSSKENDDKNNENKKEEKVKSSNLSNENRKENKENKKIIINLNDEQSKQFSNLISEMIKFPDKLDNKENHYILIRFAKDWIDGFLGKIFLKNINEKKFYRKPKIDKEKKTENIYESILKLNESNDVKKLFSKLNSISLDLVDEQKKLVLKNICINIYNDLTDPQRGKIKEKYSKLISKEITEFVFLDLEYILKVEKHAYRLLSEHIEDYSKKRNFKMNNNNENINKIKKINIANNVDKILLKIYAEFMHLKNKKDSYIYKNNNYIQEKIYFFLIINFITYRDEFIKGDKLYLFLYIKYYYEYKDYQKFLSEFENIKNKIHINSEDILNKEAKIEKNLQKEDLDEQENEEDFNSSSGYEIDKYLENNLINFIPKRYLEIYSEVVRRINNFYRIPYPLNSLVNFDNINFTFNIIDLIIIHEKYNKDREIEKNDEKNNNNKKEFMKKYKENLKKLEIDIFKYYKKSTNDYVNIEVNNKNEENKENKENKEIKDNKEKGKFVGFTINKSMRNVYAVLKNQLNEQLKIFNDYYIEYIPFGSITQFLSGKNGDIDLFLNIKRISSNIISNDKLVKDKTEILKRLYNILKKLDKNISFHQTNRLCLFTITFFNVKIDINVYGICSYYGEILLREYSLLDFRFPMLVVYLKYIIAQKGIKNSEEEKIYINSFAWTNILLTFLQDILEPPLFPRLLIEDNQKNINIKVGGGIGKEKKKILEDEFISQNIRKFNVIKDIKYLKTIENNFYKKEKNEDKEEKKKVFFGRNQMAVSEILLKFIEFIGYYFNYKYTIVNTCYEFQSFMPKIQKDKLKDDGTRHFFKKCDQEEDLLLIREPFDYTYNPCKTVSKEKLDYIKEVFREIYVNILERGEI